MHHDDFVDEIQHRIEADSHGETRRTIRAVLTTLGERVQDDEAADLAAQLPMEVDRWLENADGGQQFDFETFVERVAEREREEYPDARYHAQSVVALIADSVAEDEMADLRSNLPDEYADLFELAAMDEAFA